ncbi:hypothetical protein SESBI_43169 [Sesbania bispinosa]|nr:hypothetical protein SESBI_43169 [Sesbania bispinosa]
MNIASNNSKFQISIKQHQPQLRLRLERGLESDSEGFNLQQCRRSTTGKEAEQNGGDSVRKLRCDGDYEVDGAGGATT